MNNYKQANLSIGLDISKESIAVYIPKSDQVIEIENSSKSLKSFYSKLKKIYKKEYTDLIFVYEPTGSYSELIKKFCSQKSILSFIINPKRSSNYAKAYGNRNKSDTIDAKLLSTAIVLAKKDEIAVPVINTVVESIKELMSYYRFTMKQRVMAQNHLEAIKAKGGESFVINSLKKEINLFKAREASILDEILSIIKSDEKLLDDYNNITSIKGIGPIGGIVLLHLFLKYPDANKKQLISLTGLDPVMFDSGKSVKRKTKISKAGSKLYRGSLFMAAMTSVNHNNQMRCFYERLINNHKHSTAAYVAVIRKMILIAHSLYKNNQKYDPDIYQKASGLRKKGSGPMALS